jgi:hypothetical protein
MVRLNAIAQGIPGEVLAKVEYFNPGHSTKDRMAIKMVEDAEADGRLDEAFDLVHAALDGHMNTLRQHDGLPLLERQALLSRLSV